MTYIYKRFNDRMLIVDPGIGGTGWVIADGYNIDKYVTSGVLRVSRSRFVKNHIDQLNELSEKFSYILSQYNNIDLVVIEDQSFWSSSSKSQIAVRSGGLFKLVRLVGAYLDVCRYHNIKAELQDTNWKGQMNDKAVHERIYRTLKKKFRKHEHDAVGMWLARGGLL